MLCDGGAAALPACGRCVAPLLGARALFCDARNRCLARGPPGRSARSCVFDAPLPKIQPLLTWTLPAAVSNQGAQRGAAGRILRTPQGEPLALKDAPALREALSAFLRREFMEVSDELLQRATVHCLDPPVLSVDGLVGEGQCGEVRDAAGATGELVRSRVGASEFSVAADDSGGDIRTSSSLLVNTEVRERHPLLAAAIDGLQAAGRTLLCGGGSWTAPGMLPPAGAFCYEATQVAKYSTGQHFLAHEDAFPLHAARAQRFQRRATLLVYLNTPEGGGGTTRFEHVGCEVAPQRGRALLFFPARGGDEAGTPDARTLHTATDADGEKWIAQLWVGWGMPESGPAPPPPPQQQQAAVETSVASAAALAHVEAPPKPAMRKKKKRGAGGFGNKK